MIDHNHPAVEAARKALAADEENGCMIEQHEGNGMWTCLAHGMSADGPDMCWYVRDMPVIALNAALPHLTAVDNHPWDPLVRYHPLNVGDEVRQDRQGLARIAVVGSVDGSGNPRTAEGALIGHLDQGTWWVRHAAQPLPRKKGTLIVPADGREYIEAELWGETYHASEAILLGGRNWLGAWRSPHGILTDVTSGQIAPGTWKVGNR